MSTNKSKKKYMPVVLAAAEGEKCKHPVETTFEQKRGYGGKKYLMAECKSCGRERQIGCIGY